MSENLVSVRRLVEGVAKDLVTLVNANGVIEDQLISRVALGFHKCASKDFDPTQFIRSGDLPHSADAEQQLGVQVISPELLARIMTVWATEPQFSTDIGTGGLRQAKALKVERSDDHPEQIDTFEDLLIHCRCDKPTREVVDVLLASGEVVLDGSGWISQQLDQYRLKDSSDIASYLCGAISKLMTTAIRMVSSGGKDLSSLIRLNVYDCGIRSDQSESFLNRFHVDGLAFNVAADGVLESFSSEVESHDPYIPGVCLFHFVDPAQPGTDEVGVKLRKYNIIDAGARSVFAKELVNLTGKLGSLASTCGLSDKDFFICFLKGMRKSGRISKASLQAFAPDFGKFVLDSASDIDEVGKVQALRAIVEQWQIQPKYLTDFFIPAPKQLPIREADEDKVDSPSFEGLVKEHGSPLSFNDALTSLLEAGEVILIGEERIAVCEDTHTPHGEAEVLEEVGRCIGRLITSVIVLTTADNKPAHAFSVRTSISSTNIPRRKQGECEEQLINIADQYSNRFKKIFDAKKVADKNESVKAGLCMFVFD